MKRNKKDNLQTININMVIEDVIEMDNVKLSKRVQLEREKEMKRKQLNNIPASKRLRPNDIHRIVEHTDNSIFDEERCCLWTGYITNLRNKKKGTYINFYFREKKKVALHRLLYANFKGEISINDYIKYSCHNKGKCCNINHMVKFEYNSSDGSSSCNDDDDDNDVFSNENTNENENNNNDTSEVMDDTQYININDTFNNFKIIIF